MYFLGAGLCSGGVPSSFVLSLCRAVGVVALLAEEFGSEVSIFWRGRGWILRSAGCAFDTGRVVKSVRRRRVKAAYEEATARHFRSAYGEYHDFAVSNEAKRTTLGPYQRE
ncbi:uncharacterized protein A4U43_C03F28010 [Asparagus officinalis]|uniref:Uncharacterized protein n=1 Tax=Asparagus officinalis TaxID=4686 RepID=A0A5P1FIP0_ASPOF|nr:uncharacterized protein A4U43_C03F28010 [Asparagus officinalis]